MSDDDNIDYSDPSQNPLIVVDKVSSSFTPGSGNGDDDPIYGPSADDDADDDIGEPIDPSDPSHPLYKEVHPDDDTPVGTLLRDCGLSDVQAEAVLKLSESQLRKLLDKQEGLGKRLNRRATIED